MKKIPLTQGKFALIDDEDFELLSQHKWFAAKLGKTFYAARKIYCKPKQTTRYMHRQILRPEKQKEVDHINHDGLDNRRCNLRVCTRSQNLQNQRFSRGGSSKYRGIYYSRKKNKWRAQIGIKAHKKTYLGYFDDEKEAAKAYDVAAKELFGEFACLNFKGEQSCFQQ